MTDKQLVELIDYSPRFNDEEKGIYKSLLEKDLSEDEAREARELILELIKEKENLAVLNMYLKENQELREDLKNYISGSEENDDEVSQKFDDLEEGADNQRVDIDGIREVVSASVRKIDDIVKDTEKKYDELFKKAEQDKIKQIQEDLKRE